jgi:hypothetical protein
MEQQPEPRPKGRPHASFVVRVWHEQGDSSDVLGHLAQSLGAANLRGSVENIGCASIRYFASLADMTDIIADAVRRPDSQKGSR